MGFNYALVFLAGLAVQAGAQSNPFKLPKLNLKGEVNYAMGGDIKGTAYSAFDGDRIVTSTSTVTRMMGKESKTSSWTLVTADSMYTADLEHKKGYQAPNLLPYMAKAYDGLDKDGRVRFHSNLNEMAAMFSRVFDPTITAAGAGTALKNAQVFDVFKGEQIGAGKKSLAYRLTYQADRTLTDAEVAIVREQIVKRLREELKAVLRG